MLHYIKFSLFHILALLTIGAVVAGGLWILYGYIFVTVFIVAGDALLGDDNTTPQLHYAWVLNTLLYLALPLQSVLVFVSLWQISETDILGFGEFVLTTTNIDINALKLVTETWQKVMMIFFVGLMISTIGTITAHELIHRTWSNTSVCIGRWLLAFSFDANFSIEHVYGHHRFVGTSKDPATAPRGRNVYQHIYHSTVYGNISAWKIESLRLTRKHQRIVSVRNLCLRGYLMSLMIVFAAYALSGMWGVLFTVATGIWAKVMLEIVNYMEHYGLIRVENKRVEPKHSWNTNKKISSWAMFNLSRHSHHHAHGQLAFQHLKPYPDAPTMINGYLATMIITLIPPLWFKLMKPKLAHWDANYANEQEKTLLDSRKT